MAQDLKSDSQPSATALVGGIINDVQDLIKQQLALFKHEMTEDLRKTKAAALPLALGLGLALIGAILLCFMLVYLLWAQLALALWGCYALVGSLMAVVGGIFISVGKMKFDSFSPLQVDSAQALKENVQWITKPL